MQSIYGAYLKERSALHMRKGADVSGNRRPPQPRDRAIGAQLKSIRLSQTTLSLEAAAKLVQWSPATMSRTENGKRHITAEDVSAILAVYKVPLSQRESVIERAKAINESGWWSRAIPGVPADAGVLASYENDATAITDWSVNIVPGLLQIREYASAYMLADQIPPRDVETSWMARLSRQQVLPRVEYTAYIGEAAIHTAFGSTTAFTEQLRHLHDATTRGLGVRIVREHRPNVALLQSWMLLSFPDSPPIAYVDLLRSAVSLHNEQVDPYIQHVNLLDRTALSTAESRDMLRALVEQREAGR